MMLWIAGRVSQKARAGDPFQYPEFFYAFRCWPALVQSGNAAVTAASSNGRAVAADARAAARWSAMPGSWPSRARGGLGGAARAKDAGVVEPGALDGRWDRDGATQETSGGLEKGTTMFGRHHSSRPSWRRSRLALGALSIAVQAVACAGDDTEDQDGAAGAPARGGSGGSGASAGDCRARGVGRIEIRISGLPEGVDAELVVGGPVEAIGVSADRTLDMAAGPILIDPAHVAAPDPIVRTLFEPVLEAREFCLGEGETRRVALSYVPVATSHALWADAANGDGDLLGFEASSLTASAAALAPVAVVDAGAGKDVAFDKQGNLWSMGATLADPHLVRFPAAVARGAGPAQPDRSIDIDNIECLPALRAFAFDRGALWVSTCGNVVALAAEQLEASGSVTPRITIGGVTDNGDIAFDISRNLWVTDGDALLRYDAERLEASIDTPDLRLGARDAADDRGIRPSNLAFDSAGNLWIIDAGRRLVSQIASADLGGTGERAVNATLSITLGASALLERPAFDESGGLWIALEANRLGRLSPAQLGVSSGSSAPSVPETIITSPGMGNARRIALFPAPHDLPLYHRFP